MSVEEAARVLDVATGASADDLRAAYRRELRRTHPDVNAARDATERTVALGLAYRVLLTAPAPPSPSRSPSPPPPRAPDDSGPERVHLVDDETIAVHAPAAEALLAIIDAAHRLGEIGYLDPSAGLLEVVVEFVAAPTSSVVLSLQGRANGTTEVFCSVEPLSGGASPPVAAVVRLLLRTLQGEDPAG